MEDPLLLPQQLAEGFFKGIVSRIKALGPGRFIADPQRSLLVRSGGVPSKIIFALRYVFDDDQMMIRIYATFSKDGSRFKRIHYAHHCGPEPLDSEVTHFRIDFDRFHEYHVHLRGFEDDHFDVSLIEPNVRDNDPFHFLDLVERFRRTGVIPLTRKL